MESATALLESVGRGDRRHNRRSAAVAGGGERLDNPGMSKERRSFLTSRAHSFGYAFRGLWTLLRTQRNAWIHAAATVLAVVAGFVVHLGASDWCWLIAAIALVWIAEGLNTAVEFVCDALHPERHPLIRNAKDIGAAAVLLAALAAAAIGAIVFWPHISGGIIHQG